MCQYVNVEDTHPIVGCFLQIKDTHTDSQPLRNKWSILTISYLFIKQNNNNLQFSKKKRKSHKHSFILREVLILSIGPHRFWQFSYSSSKYPPYEYFSLPISSSYFTKLSSTNDHKILQANIFPILCLVHRHPHSLFNGLCVPRFSTNLCKAISDENILRGPS